LPHTGYALEPGFSRANANIFKSLSYSQHLRLNYSTAKHSFSSNTKRLSCSWRNYLKMFWNNISVDT